MKDTITTIYVFCDEVLKAQGYRDDCRSRYSAAEVMTVPLVAALYYSGNHALTRNFLHEHGYTQNTLSASRFCRRLAAIPQAAWEMVFAMLAEIFVKDNTSSTYAIDSAPVLICQNARINRCRIFPVQEHENAQLRGYQASKKRYFYGFKIHLLVTQRGEPVEFFISQGSLHDLEGLKRMTVDLPPGSTLYGDKAYQDAKEEVLLLEAGDIRFHPLRRLNSKQPLSQALIFLVHVGRQQVETAFSRMETQMPRHIHAVSPTGFLLKLQAAVIALAFDRIMAHNA